MRSQPDHQVKFQGEDVSKLLTMEIMEIIIFWISCAFFELKWRAVTIKKCEGDPDYKVNCISQAYKYLFCRQKTIFNF